MFSCLLNLVLQFPKLFIHHKLTFDFRLLPSNHFDVKVVKQEIILVNEDTMPLNFPFLVLGEKRGDKFNKTNIDKGKGTCGGSRRISSLFRLNAPTIIQYVVHPGIFFCFQYTTGVVLLIFNKWWSMCSGLVYIELTEMSINSYPFKNKNHLKKT